MATKTRGRSPPTAGASLPSKRRKLSYDSENDSGDEFFAGLTETEQLPLDESVPTQRLPIPLTPSKNIGGSDATIPTQLLDIVSASPLATSQPTQILPRPSDYTPTLTSPPVVQVQASSPVLSTLSSPAKPSSGAARTSSFFPQKLNVKVVDLSSQSPQYIGSSSEGETSDYDIKPMFSNTTKKPIPAASSLRSRKENSISQTEERVPQTPIISMNTLAARFGYNPTPKVGRLDSLTRKSRPTSTYGSATQRKPEPATLTLDITLSEIESFEKRSAVSRMKSVLPNKPLRELLSMLEKCRGNYDDAMDKLTQHENFIDLTSDEPRYIKTANRGVGAGRMAIKDKWSTTQATKRDDSTPTTAGTKRRRLVRGSNRNSRERSESPQAPITIDDDSDDSAIHEDDDSEDERNLERKVLSYVNKCSGTELADIACTTDEIAMAIIAKRPFSNIDDVREVTVDTSTTSTTTDGKKKRGKRFKAIGDKVIDICLETWRGYEAVDLLITKVEALGRPIAASIKSWGVDVQTGTGSGELKMTDINVGSDSGSAKDSGIGTPIDDDDAAVKGAKRIKPTTFKEQPKNMREGVQLKDYQLAGLNWLNLLYEKKLSCILADEMGLGKTCQVISFFAHLLSRGISGPHLVVVPSSTLENWLREFANFCPALKVEPYYGSQRERPIIRESLRKDRSWNVLVTTYQLATGDKNDRGFLKSLQFNCCVYDEGHLLKNGSSARYDALIKLPADFRLLLTGTPLQNNLQELASLLAFILPSVFDEKRADLASIFKYKAKTTDDEETNSALLSQQRIRRARAMMTPFVLRRKKAQVLKHLPSKTTRVEHCTLNRAQNKIYQDEIASAKAVIEARATGIKPNKNSSNVMMQLRKAAIHPLLFRENYPNEKLRKMSKEIMKEEAYRNNDANYIYEDMEVMNDLELSRLCTNFPKTIGKYALNNDEWMESGKIDALRKLLVDMKQNGDRVLVFSQFTQVLDILELVLTTLDMGYLRIDGSTPVDARQDLIDQYHAETDIMVFLLSTKAGGFGINLACANKVVIFDSSFNPHDDAQASDRAHRVGQTRNVEVIRLVTKGTIEEQIMQLANTKLALDQSISEIDDKAMEGKGEELVAKMLLQSSLDEDKKIDC